MRHTRDRIPFPLAACPADSSTTSPGDVTMAAGEVLTLCAFRTPSPPERLSLGLVGLSISPVQPVQPVGASCDFRRSSNSISAASADVYPRTTFVSLEVVPYVLPSCPTDDGDGVYNYGRILCDEAAGAPCHSSALFSTSNRPGVGLCQFHCPRPQRIHDCCPPRPSECAPSLCLVPEHQRVQRSPDRCTLYAEFGLCN